MNVILLGPPGSGKGTQGEYLEKNFRFKKISTGDLLRAEIKKRSQIGKEIEKTLGKGKFVSNDIVLSLLKGKFINYQDNNGFILDGYPRNLLQARSLESLLLDVKSTIDIVFYFKIDKTILVERICNRFYCGDCNANYNKIYKNTKIPNVCDYCGGSNLKIRKDDDIKVVESRLDDYYTQTVPLVSYYKEKGILFEIDAKESIDKISKMIKEIIVK